MDQSVFRKVIIFLNLFIVGWAVISSPPQNILYHFQEHRLVTYFSAMQLAWLALISYLIYDSGNLQSTIKYRQFSEDQPQYIWLVFSLGFLWLAFDELLMLHEGIDFLFHQIYHWQESAWSDRIDDLIVFSYTLIGGLFFYRYRQQLVAYKHQILPKLKTILGLIVIMVLLDLATNRHDLIRNRQLFQILSLLEELFKLAIEVNLLLMVYLCWKHTIHQLTHENH